MSAFLGRKGGAKTPPMCLLLSKDSALLGKGELKSKPEDFGIQIKLTSGEVDDLDRAKVIQVIPTGKTKHQPQMARYLLHKGDLVVLEPMRQEGEAMRENFRMPVDFESFIYPEGGGRASIRAMDLSCGGVAFYTAQALAEGEKFEIVIPITAEAPLIMEAEVLRVLPFSGPIQRYAAKFVNVINDQESALREAVFLAQMQTVQTRKK